jgi:hypothetical protein
MANNNGSIKEIRRKVTSTYELISTSYHEAGHTIYALLNGQKVDFVRVFETKRTKRIDGITCYHSIELSDINRETDPDFLASALQMEVGLKYAGLAAEKFHFKKMSGSDKFPLYWRDGSSDDTREAAALIKKYSPVKPGAKRYAYKKKIIRCTFDLLEEHWDAVTIVAHALIYKKRLSFLELKELLTKKSDEKDFWKVQFKKINDLFENSQT